MKASTLVGWALVSILTLFVFLNWRQQYINFLFAEIRMPLSLAMIISAVTGFIAANLLRAHKKERHD